MTAQRLMGRLAFVMVASLAIGPIAACSDDEPAKGEATLDVDGTALVERQAGERETVTGRSDVRVGDEVTIREGAGTLVLPGGATLEMRADRDGGQDTKLVMGPVPVLLGGDLLVVAPGGSRLKVGGTSVQVVGGAARVSKPAGVEVAVAAYDSPVEIDSAAQVRRVEALREMQVPALGQPPDRARPLMYDGTDPWDRRFLGAAIDLGERLEALAAGYTQNLAQGEGRTVAFFMRVLPGLADEAEFAETGVDPGRPAGDTLIGAAIAELGRHGTFGERWQAVFEFHDEGAAWGIVALDQGVETTPLIKALTGAVNSSPLVAAPPRPGSTTLPTTVPTTTPSSGGPSPTTPTTPTTVPEGSSPTFDDNDGGLLGPLVAPLTPVLEPITEVLGGLLSGLLGGLLGS